MLFLFLALLCVKADNDHGCMNKCAGVYTELYAFYKNLPCNECGTGTYRSCPKGSADAYNNRTMCVRATKALYTHEQAMELCSKLGGFLAFSIDQAELEAVASKLS